MHKDACMPYVYRMHDAQFMEYPKTTTHTIRLISILLFESVDWVFVRIAHFIVMQILFSS